MRVRNGSFGSSGDGMVLLGGVSEAQNTYIYTPEGLTRSMRSLAGLTTRADLWVWSRGRAGTVTRTTR